MGWKEGEAIAMRYWNLIRCYLVLTRGTKAIGIKKDRLSGKSQSRYGGKDKAFIYSLRNSTHLFNIEAMDQTYAT
jgi:hypothetical protein